MAQMPKWVRYSMSPHAAVATSSMSGSSGAGLRERMQVDVLPDDRLEAAPESLMSPVVWWE